MFTNNRANPGSSVMTTGFDVLSNWKYADSVSKQRRDALASSVSFKELTSRVVDDIRGIQLRTRTGEDRGLTDCIQPIFSFELPSTGDELFNGPWGYRAQYWQSPLRGITGNSELIEALVPKLVSTLDGNDDPNLRKINICASLRALSAKLWIQEIPSLLVSPTVDLAVDRWHAEAERGIELARFGLSAPVVTRFEVKGALLDPYGNEVVPASKVSRHYDIYHYGFS